MSYRKRVLARSRRDLSTGCRIFEGAVTPGTGRPRMTINGRERDPRTWVYEDEHGLRLDPWIRMRSTCGDSRCVAPDHLSIPGDGLDPSDYTQLSCPTCPNTVAILAAISRGAYCSGGSRPHAAAAMKAVSSDTLYASLTDAEASEGNGTGVAL